MKSFSLWRSPRGAGERTRPMPRTAMTGPDTQDGRRPGVEAAARVGATVGAAVTFFQLNVWSCAGLAALLAPEPMVLYMMQPAGTFQPSAKRALASLVGRLAWVPWLNLSMMLLDSAMEVTAARKCTSMPLANGWAWTPAGETPPFWISMRSALVPRMPAMATRKLA